MSDIIIKNITIQDAQNEWAGDPNGYLLIWELPQKNQTYFMGVDIGGGKGLSNSVIHVLKKGTIYTPDLQVAEFACDFVDPTELAPIIDFIGRMYWCDEYDLPAMAAIEINNYGVLTQYNLQSMYSYPHFFMRKTYNKTNGILSNTIGWQTTAKTRKELIIHGINKLKTGDWIINSQWFVDEMDSFRNEKALGSTFMDSEQEALARHISGSMDDRLFAGFIASWAANDIRETGVDPAVERAKAVEQAQLQEARIAAGEPRKSWQNTLFFDDGSLITPESLRNMD